MERPVCHKCGNPLITVIPGQLLRCSVCNLYHHIRPDARAASQTETMPTLTSTPSTETAKTSFAPAVKGDMKVFAERVIATLCPPEQGYSPVVVKEVRKIYDVLEEKEDFAEWFTKVRQMLSLKNYQLAKTLYDSLEGLKSQEAKELKEQWYSFVKPKFEKRLGERPVPPDVLKQSLNPKTPVHIDL